VTRIALSKVTLAELLETYAAAAKAHGLACEKGDHKAANRNYPILSRICIELRKRGLEAQKQLMTLLGSTETHVRAWAAAHCLEFAPLEAELVLAGIADGSGMAAFDAKMTLQEWRAGRLKFPH
jgi:hypothetical protein